MPQVPSSLRIEDPYAILAVFLGILAMLFFVASRPAGAKFFRVVPLLIFAYFVPTLFSNVGIIPTKAPLYDAIKFQLLPASLLLLTMSVDIPAVLRLGRNALFLFLGGTVSVVMGGPLALLLFGWMIPPPMGEQAWRGLAALSGSWIGGGANFVAIGESVQASDSIMATMVIIDVVLANIWLAVLLFFAGNEKRLDASLGANRRSLEQLRDKVVSFQKEVARKTTLNDLLLILLLAFGGTVVATHIASLLPDIGGILGHFAWTVILVTAMGVAASLTPLRKLEGAGASKIGTVFLYLLVASIGAKAEFAKVLEVPSLLLIGAAWIVIHALVMLLLWYLLKAPIFFMAVGSQANIGGAASAPIVASAFHPALAPVGALMGVLGYVIGTYAGLMCAFLLKWAHQLS